MGDRKVTRAIRPDRDELPHLLAEVRRTRTARHERQGLTGVHAESMLPVREASLEALETYASELLRRGWPVPPKMLLEIKLLRSLSGVHEYYRA